MAAPARSQTSLRENLRQVLEFQTTLNQRVQDLLAQISANPKEEEAEELAVETEDGVPGSAEGLAEDAPWRYLPDSSQNHTEPEEPSLERLFHFQNEVNALLGNGLETYAVISHEGFEAIFLSLLEQLDLARIDAELVRAQASTGPVQQEEIVDLSTDDECDQAQPQTRAFGGRGEDMARKHSGRLVAILRYGRRSRNSRPLQVPFDPQGFVAYDWLECQTGRVDMEILQRVLEGRSGGVYRFQSRGTIGEPSLRLRLANQTRLRGSDRLRRARRRPPSARRWTSQGDYYTQSEFEDRAESASLWQRQDGGPVLAQEGGGSHSWAAPAQPAPARPTMQSFEERRRPIPAQPQRKRPAPASGFGPGGQ